MNRNKQNNYYSFLVLDILCLLFSLIIAYYLRHKNFELFSIGIYKEILFVLVAVNVLLFFTTDPFEDVLVRGYYVEFRKTLAYVILNFFITILYMFVVKTSSDYSRITLVLTYIIYLFSSYICRITLKWYYRKKSIDAIKNGEKSLLIVCKGNELADSINRINNSYVTHRITAAYVVDNKGSDESVKSLNSEEVLKFISTNWVDDILILCDYKKIPKKVLSGFKDSGIPIHIKLDRIVFFEDKKQIINTFGDYDVITAVTNEYSNWDMFVKRVVDIIGGVIGCIITLFLIIIIGPIIYIKSPGPIIYVSDRVGKNGKIFKFYKFRSMVMNADDLKETLKDNNRVKDGFMFKLDDDPRIIPGIGHFIRKTSLDEFPQFFNVLKGDMSLVGTRPPTLDEWNRYTPYYRSRLSIKPGITGLWQVSGRSNITDFNEVVRLDNEYINNWSLGLDIKILFKTVFMMFKKDKEGAL